jgi:hypothetical protein
MVSLWKQYIVPLGYFYYSSLTNPLFGTYSFVKEYTKDKPILYNIKSLKDFIKKVIFSIKGVINNLNLAKEIVILY